ncbi:MAG: hypothetical protein P1U56_19565 [Saprospiraceae bacterium]|nr:hypothetical protein [Saprospiraceae bacterium]
MKLYVFLFSLMIITLPGQAQKQNISTLTVSIDWSKSLNKKHTYKDVFSQQDDSYIKRIYSISKNVSGYVQDENNTNSYYHDGNGNDPIEFTILEEGVERTETYKNAIKPSKNKLFKLPTILRNITTPIIEGSLPKGTTTYFSDSSKGIEMGILINKEQRNVKIEILSIDHELIQVIVNDNLKEGWHNFKWDTKDIRPGKYILNHTVDNKKMAQQIEVECNRGSLLKRFFDWIL